MRVMMRKYNDEFKRNIVGKVFNGQSVSSVSREIGVNESLIHKWSGRLWIMATALNREPK